MLEKNISLPEGIWSNLNLSWATFFALMGIINLYVAFNYSTDTWVNFKLFGSTGLMLVFVVLQGLMLGKFITENEDSNT
jgi:intracellular septation protein